MLVHGRRREKCERVVRDIKTGTGNDQVEPVYADFASLEDTRTLAEDVTARVPRLDVLVNNGGGAMRTSTSLYLATSPEVADVSGLYFVKCKPAKTSRNALDDAAAERLWRVSARLTGLTA